MTRLMSTPRKIDRATAMFLGLTRYYTGLPCGRGHVSPRLVANKACAACNQEHSRAAKKAHREDARVERDAEYARRETARIEHGTVYQARLAAQAEARTTERLAKIAAKTEERRMQLAATIQVRAERQALGMRSVRRRGKSRAAGHEPAPHERECPPRPLDGRCQCCGRKREPLVLDHDHNTGEFRGWLCNNCNVGVAMLGDLPGGIHAALEYLRRVYRDKPEPWDTEN